jgi:hypothetical protein
MESIIIYIVHNETDKEKPKTTYLYIIIRFPIKFKWENLINGAKK